MKKTSTEMEVLKILYNICAFETFCYLCFRNLIGKQLFDRLSTN